MLDLPTKKWVYPPSKDVRTESSREDTGQVFMTFKEALYQDWHARMNASHKMPLKNTLNFAPPPGQSLVVDGLVHVAIPVSQLIEGDEDVITLKKSDVAELSKADWYALKSETLNPK